MQNQRFIAVASIATVFAMLLGAVVGTLLMPPSALAMAQGGGYTCDESCGQQTPYGECHEDDDYSCRVSCDENGCECEGFGPGESGCAV